MTAEPITLGLWQGICPAGALSCDFTVDVRTLGDATTNPGATIDEATFLTAVPPAGYTFSYDPATFILTVTVTTSEPGQVSSRTVRDSTGELSNAALIELPTLTPAPQVIDLATAITATPAAIPSRGPSGAVRVINAEITLTDVGNRVPSGDLDVVVTWPSWLDGATPVIAGTDWVLVSSGPGTATIRYTGLPPGATTPVAVPPATLTLTEVPSTLGPLAATLTASMAPGAGGDTNPTNDSASTPVSVTPAPDLTPTITLPDAVFTTIGQNKTAVVTLTELNGVATQGPIVVRMSRAGNYAIQPYDATLTTATPSGGSPVAVNNALFTASSASPAFWSFTITPGTVIPANGSLSFAVSIQNVGTLPWTASLAAVIVTDPTWLSDSNDLNNSAVTPLAFTPTTGEEIAPAPADVELEFGTTEPSTAPAPAGVGASPTGTSVPAVPTPANDSDTAGTEIPVRTGQPPAQEQPDPQPGASVITPSLAPKSTPAAGEPSSEAPRDGA